MPALKNLERDAVLNSTVHRISVSRHPLQKPEKPWIQITSIYFRHLFHYFENIPPNQGAVETAED